jgi:adenylate cyclase
MYQFKVGKRAQTQHLREPRQFDLTPTSIRLDRNQSELRSAFNSAPPYLPIGTLGEIGQRNCSVFGVECDRPVETRSGPPEPKLKKQSKYGIIMDRFGQFILNKPQWLLLLVAIALIGLPIAVWQDLTNLSDQNLRRQAISMDRIIGDVRSYYSKNVVGRVNATDDVTTTLHNYHEVDGAIPIPATLSIELGKIISASEGHVEYRFISDFPFLNRQAYALTPFEIEALSQFRENEELERLFFDSEGTKWDHSLTLATPVTMSKTCVNCHNSHAQSSKTDWEVGDVRGLQTITIFQPIAFNIWSFKWLLGYLLIAGTFGLLFSFYQFRLAGRFRNMIDELAANNEFLANISAKLSKYLSPQVYRSIFAGERDVEISTERKKLTVFFSDIKDFTATTERLQPEELTEILNEYFTEMSKIAEFHGATIDKFIGDAIVAFFGDPETKGAAEDARACVCMALEMQSRLTELEVIWQSRGLEHPFRARMGINTGYCNVGNFGSEDRMDYTIIGAEANLAARLEGIAEPGGIVVSFETYAHVRDLIKATPLEPVRFKGIARDVIPYRLDNRSNVSKAGIEEQDSLIKKIENLSDDARKALLEALNNSLNSGKT